MQEVSSLILASPQLHGVTSGRRQAGRPVLLLFFFVLFLFFVDKLAERFMKKRERERERES